MNYDQFRAAWHEALDAAGLLPFPPFPSETVELRWMSRGYNINVSPHKKALSACCDGS
jgi:hypothetical protein